MKTMINYAKTAVHWRFVHSGEHDAGLSLIDLNLYDTSLFANACIFTAGDTMLLFDAGTSNTVNQILTYLDFHSLHPRHVLVVPSHHHFDHTGGLKPLIESLNRRGMQTSVLTTPLMARALEDLPRDTARAVQQFTTMAGTIQKVDPADIITIEPGKRMEVDGMYSLSLLPTPGHCPDHVSPVVYRDGAAHLCFFGEALGINLKKELSPLPACVAPSFDSIQYKKSIQLIKSIQPRIGVFSHVGGVKGRENVIKTCNLALERLEEVTSFVSSLAAGGRKISTREMTVMMRDRYHEYIATCMMDAKIVDTLSFLLVYGMLKDQGLK